MADPSEPSTFREPPAAGSATSHHVRLAIAGDRESLGWIVTRLSPLLKAQAAWRLGPRLRAQVDPDDVVAEAWLVALRRLGDLVSEEGRTTRRLLAFLGTTILNLVNHRIEDAVRRGRRMAPMASPGEAPSDRMANLEATITGAVTRASRTELGGAVDACLASLAAKDREVILLRVVEGLSNEDAALEIGDAPSTVSHRYQRALVKLRQTLPKSFLDELA